MNKQVLKICGIAAMAVITSTSFAEGGCEENGCASKKDKHANRPTREELLKKFDINGDGQLDAEERVAVREEMKKRRGEKGGSGNKGVQKMKERFDADGDGQLNEDEKTALREAMKEEKEKRQQKREEMKKKYDADGDGQLSEEERNVMREAFRERRKNNSEEVE
ncbi:MAG TPA: hypothetical protein VIR63_03505 [Pontiella sp.]